MRKRIVTFMLAVVMGMVIIGCGNGEGKEDEQKGTEGQKEDKEPENSNESEELVKLLIAFPTWTGAGADTLMVQDKINEITVEKLGIEVELQISDSGSFKQNMTLALSGGEPIDIMSTLMADYSGMVSQGYLLDLEEDDLLETYGKGIVEAVGQEYIDACRVNGVLYGLPNNRDVAQGRGGWAVGTQYLEAVGWTEPEGAGEIIKITQEEVNDLLAKLHAEFPDIEAYRPVTGSLLQYTSVDQLGGNFFGVLLDYGQELKVENLFESNDYYEYCQMMYDWNQAGYISKDAATDTTAVTALGKAGTLMSYTTTGKPGSKMQETNNNGHEMTIFQVRDDFISSNSVAQYPWTIPMTTEHPEEAMILLNELYTNKELADLFVYGVKDVHYGINEDGFLDINMGSSTGTYSTLGWLYFNQFLCTVTAGNDADLWDNIRQFNDNAKKSAAMGFTFDSTPVATEITAVQNVYDEYQKSLEFGFVDPSVGIPEMNEKMMRAGLQKIIDEKQRQLDEWAAQK